MKKNLKNIIECQQKLHSISDEICEVFNYTSSDVKLLLVDDDYLIYYCDLFSPRAVITDCVLSLLPADCEYSIRLCDCRLSLHVRYELF